MPFVNTDKPLSSRVIGKFLQHCMRGSEDECWRWVGPMHKVSGYGIFEVYNIEYKAHRVSFFYFNKRTTESEFDVLHTCDNRWCCNPKHLYEGDNVDNNRDRDERKPGATINRGSANGAAIITETDIPEIFRLKKMGYTQEQIAYRYGVVFSTIGKILRREMWKHVKID
jgi:hypothetical protein